MSIFSKLLGKKQVEEEGARVGGVEDFMTLIRVYYQAVMAAQLGISNINFLPDMAVFKRTLKIPTQNNKLGVAERTRCKKMLMDIYGINEFFFKEIDTSVKKHCKSVNDIKNYLFMFQGFSQDLMMVVGNLMQWKFRMPGMFKKLLRSMTEKTIHDILTKTNWKDDSVRKTCVNIRQYQHALGYSESWMNEYVYNIVVLAKKEPNPKKTKMDSLIENHPLEPFLPAEATLLMLGSFPPQKKRWSMDFFYPNWNNDMWRIFGLIFFGDKEHFVLSGKKAFDKERLIHFLKEKGVALYDTACTVKRLKSNASDKYLEIVEPTDIGLLLKQLPACKSIVTTGQKATDTLCAQLHIEEPPVGGKSKFEYTDRQLWLYRMPSSSRAYPLKLEKKAEIYRSMLCEAGIFMP